MDIFGLSGRLQTNRHAAMEAPIVKPKRRQMNWQSRFMKASEWSPATLNMPQPHASP